MHFTQDHHYTSLHFIALHNASVPIFLFTALLDVSSPRFKNRHFSSVIISFLILFLKIYDLQSKVVSAFAGSWFHSLITLFSKEYLPIFFFVSWSYFTIVIIPAQVAWSF